MRLTASTGLLLLTAALVTGCTTTPDAEPTATMPSASPTPTSTPTPDSEDPSTWVISDAGIGPIELGAPFPTAIAEMPEGTTNDLANCAWTAWWNSPDQSLQVYTARSWDAADDGPVTLVATAALAETPSADGPRTAEGIGVGSTVEEVLAAYPDAVESADSTDSTIVHLNVGDMFFTYREAPVITSVTVTTADAPPYELCG